MHIHRHTLLHAAIVRFQMMSSARCSVFVEAVRGSEWCNLPSLFDFRTLVGPCNSEHGSKEIKHERELLASCRVAPRHVWEISGLGVVETESNVVWQMVWYGVNTFAFVFR